MFFNHLTNAGDFVNRHIVDDEHGVGEWPFVHARKQALNETVKVRTGDSVLDDLQMEDTI